MPTKRHTSGSSSRRHEVVRGRRTSARERKRRCLYGARSMPIYKRVRREEWQSGMRKYQRSMKCFALADERAVGERPVHVVVGEGSGVKICCHHARPNKSGCLRPAPSRTAAAPLAIPPFVTVYHDRCWRTYTTGARGLNPSYRRRRQTIHQRCRNECCNRCTT